MPYPLYRPLEILGANSGWGAKIRNTEKGPQALIKISLIQHLQQHGIGIRFIHQLYPKVSALATSNTITAKSDFLSSNILPKETLPYVLEFCHALYTYVTRAIDAHHFPIILGGDHSCAVGTWSAVTNTYKIAGKMRLIWIDAHLDAHIPKTSPSGAYHGMPVAALLGYGPPGWSDFEGKKPKISPQHLVYIGAHNYEEEEWQFLQQLGVKIYYMHDIQKHGLKTIFYEALAIVQKDTEGFGISFDLDTIDPRYAPGVGSPTSNGLAPGEILPILKGLVHNTSTGV